MKIFSVRDSALGEFLNPFTTFTAELAIRSFKDNANQSDCPINAHPEDYELFELGSFNPVSGHVQAHAAPISISRAKDVVPQPTQGSLKLASSN